MPVREGTDDVEDAAQGDEDADEDRQGVEAPVGPDEQCDSGAGGKEARR